ncbi:MAG TPA: hypothetical protein VHP99_09665 [Pyrinomonadaceae bacterium]|jgi:hypothetical protein|nr:hypothetical protein [Pyrinomonadaceae bacterium]
MSRDRELTSLCLALAAILLGIALYLSGGFYNVRALELVTVVYVLCVLGVVLRPRRGADVIVHGALLVVLAAGFAFQSYLLFRETAIWWPVALMSVAFGSALILKPKTLVVWWVSLGLITAIALAHFVIGWSAIRGLVDPNFDVYWCHMQSLEALLKGINPHSLTIAYEHPDELKYPASYVFDGRVHIGFPYPPLSLFLALPGYLAGGDYRYSGLAATTLSAFLIGYARPSRLSLLAAALFLSTPAMSTVLKMGWTEPFVVLLLALTLFTACRAPKFLPYTLGLLIAVKQYAIFAALGVFLLPIEHRTLKSYAVIIIKALAVATAVTLPWMLWNVHGFLSDVVLLQFRLPFRMDALSYLVWLTYNTGVQPPAVIGFVMIAPAVALMAWRGSRTPAGLAVSVALIFLSFFAFNKAAFINYYFFVIGAMCCAIALAGQSARAAVSGEADG